VAQHEQPCPRWTRSQQRALTHVSKRSKHAWGLRLTQDDGTRRLLVAPWLPRGSGLASAVPHAPRRKPGNPTFLANDVSSTDVLGIRRERLQFYCPRKRATWKLGDTCWHQSKSLDRSGRHLVFSIRTWPEYVAQC
jgi:hypothetical protein